ncbi:MAG: response regulator [Pseudomonadota bacterium]
MTKGTTLLLLEDEPLILMDLEFAAEDQGCDVLATSTCEAALGQIERHGNAIDAAILDVSLGAGLTCFPVAQALDRLGIPYVLHSGDLDRHNERIRELNAQLIAKPAAPERVISAAIGASAR